MKPNFTAVNDGPSERSSPRNQSRPRRSQVVVEEEEEEEVVSGEENGVEEEEVFSGEGQEVEDQQSDQEALEQEEPEQEESEEAEEEDDQEHQFKRIMDYRWVDDKIELRVEWSDGERTWSDEEIFHQDSPEALFDFWRNQPGGRPENPNDPGVYLVFAIRKHRTFRGKKQVLVEWLGYDSSEQTWENQSYIEQVAKEHVDDYMSKLQGTDKAKPKTNTKATSTSNGSLSKKKGIAKPVARGRGRPPKAATKPTTQKTQGRTRVTKR